MAGYTQKYILIYAMQACSILLGVVSLFIVIPYLSSNKELYGIYAVCSSLTLFFSYADIGFVSASLKYTSEAFIQGKKELEAEILGFSCLVLLSFLCIISAGILVLAYEPKFLIDGIKEENIETARRLLVILAFSSPVFCFQRIVQVVFMARLSDYLFQIVQIVGNIFKLLSVFYFFRSGSYDIVGYYLTYQLISLIAVMISFVIARLRLDFDIITFLKNIKYNNSIYVMIRDLAFASLFSTICWVLFYEIDNIAISKLWGAEAVAIYSIAFSVLSLFRTFLGMMFSPFTPRMNYFVGEGNIAGLNGYTRQLMELFMPICIVPIIVLVILSRPYIYSWVGDEYEESIIIVSCLLLCNILAFISYPSNIYISSLKKIKYLYVCNVMMLLIYWGGIFLFYKDVGILIFAIMKTAGMVMASVYSFIVVFYLMKASVPVFICHILKRNALPVVACITVAILIRPYLLYEQSKIGFFINLVMIVCVCLICFLMFYMGNPLMKSEANRIVVDCKKFIFRQ